MWRRAHDGAAAGQRPRAADGAAFSVISYNVLADQYVRGGQDRPHVAATTWVARLAEQSALVLRWARDERRDVICLQEVSPPYFETLCTLLGGEGEGGEDERYDGVLQARYKTKNRGGEGVTSAAQEEEHSAGAWCATFYRRSRWALAWEDHRSRALLLGLVTQEEGAAAAEPQPRQSLAVVNVHLIANGEEAARVSQMASALTRARARQPQHTVVAGDFNARPGSAVDELLLGQQGAHAMCNAYAKSGLVERPSYLVPGFAARLDHVWHSGSLCTAATLDALTGALDALRAAGGLPCPGYPSDHLPVGALFEPSATRATAADAAQPAMPSGAQAREQVSKPPHKKC